MIGEIEIVFWLNILDSIPEYFMKYISTICKVTIR